MNSCSIKDTEVQLLWIKSYSMISMHVVSNLSKSKVHPTFQSFDNVMVQDIYNYLSTAKFKINILCLQRNSK